MKYKITETLKDDSVIIFDVTIFDNDDIEPEYRFTADRFDNTLSAYSPSAYYSDDPEYFTSVLDIAPFFSADLANDLATALAGHGFSIDNYKSIDY